MKLKPQTRFLQLAEAPKIDVGKRTLTFPFSSEAPVKRWFGEEILQHDPGSADLTRLNDRAPLLFNHEMNDVIGVVEKAWIDTTDRRGYATVRFAKTARANEVLGMVEDGILPNVSFAYRIDAAREDPKTNQIFVTRYEPLEVSIVTVPADQSVGIGRAYPNEETEVQITRIADIPATEVAAITASNAKGEAMSDDLKPAAAAPAVPKQDDRTPVQMMEDRVKAIQNICRANQVPPEVEQKWIASGTDWNTIGNEMLEFQRIKGEATKHQTPPYLDLERKDLERYSLMRAIRASTNKDWSKAGLELECNKTLSARLNRIPRSETAFFVPLDVMLRSTYGKRDMTAAGVSGSNYLISTDNQPGSFVDLLRNQSITMRAGITRMAGLVGNVTIPKMTAGNTAYWLTDETTQITESQPTIGQVSLSPKNVAALTELSHQLLQQSTPDAEQLVLTSIARDIALAVDVGVIRGAGSGGEPHGIVGTSNVGSVSGTSLAAAGVIEFQTDVAAANALMPGCAYITTPAVAGLLMARPELPTSGTTRMWLGNLLEGSLYGLPAYASNQMATATMLFGWWPSIILGEWGVLELMTNPFSDFTRGLTAVRGWYTCDVAIRYAAAFSYSSSIT